MLQEQDPPKILKINDTEEIHTQLNSKPDKPLADSQLDFQKNYPKNIFIPMIEYLAEIGLKQQYEECVGSREQFEGKNVVSLGLIHKLMGARWFKQSVEKKILISNISNKILMNSKIKKKLFHLYIVKNLFEVYDEDLKEFKKRISKLANSISQKEYTEDQLFQYPSSILYLLRLFYKLISIKHSDQFHNKTPDFYVHSTQKMDLQDYPQISIQRSLSGVSQIDKVIVDQDKNSKQGSKQQYKFYIRKIIHCFNSQLMNKEFILKSSQVQGYILQRQKQLIEKYKFPSCVPSWDTFIYKVVKKCFQSYQKSAKITHAMMNQWITNFKEHVTSIKGFVGSGQENKKIWRQETRKQTPYKFSPFILQYYPNLY